MSFNSGYEKSVKGGTKSKLAAPKTKYVAHLLDATRSGEAAIGEVFRALQYRLKEPTWTVVFKALIITHMLIRDGYKDSVLDYLANSHQFRLTALTSTGCSPMSEQGPNIDDYGTYLTARVKAFESVKTDYVKTKSDQAGQGRLRKLLIDKGLLRETESVQKLIGPLIQCKFLENEVANEGVINILEHYFEMSRPDAERALKIYKVFVEQTDGVIVFMSLARSLESVTRLEIPNLQHAPTSLGTSLEEYINDPDFEQNRIQYLARKSNGNSGSRVETSVPARKESPLKSALKKGPEGASTAAPQLPSQLTSSGNTELIDFFGTIEPQQPTQIQQGQPYYQGSTSNGNDLLSQNTAQNRMSMNPYMMQQQQQQVQAQMMGPQTTGNPYQMQVPMQQQSQQPQYSMPQQTQQQPVQHQQQQQQAMPQQMTGYNPYASQTLPIQSTGAGFGSFTPQPSSTNSFTTGSLQPQATGSNPFRRSMLPPMTTGASEFGMMAPQITGGNPFSRAPPSTGTPLFALPSALQPYPTQAQQQMPLSSQTTGNPFNKNRIVSDPLSSQSQAHPAQMQVNMTGNLMPQQTGSSNPFRRSMMPVAGQQQSFGGR